MTDKGELLDLESRAAWRAWLAQNHAQATEARLVIYKTGARREQLTLNDATEEALCFGWVDVRSQRIDDARYTLIFVPRKPGSAWSLSNIERVEQLTKDGLMTEAGERTVAEAKANGQWDLALAVERTDEIPPELQAALLKNGALDGYIGLSHSRKKQILRRLLTAKRPEMRDRIIEAIVGEVIESM